MLKGIDCLDAEVWGATRVCAVIQDGERRYYSCYAFRKGVIPPDAG